MDALTFVNPVLLTVTVYLIVTSLIVETMNVKSAILFKVLPFFLGWGTLISYGILNGFISI